MASLTMTAPARIRSAIDCPFFASFVHTLAARANGESLRDRFLDEQPLDRQASLPAIRVTAPNGGARCRFEVCIGKNNHGVLATQFEDRRYEFLCTSFCNLPPGPDASGEKNFIGARLDERLPHFSSTLNHGDEVLREAGAAKKPFDQLSASRRKVTRLRDDRVPGCDGRNNLAHRNR